MTTPVIQHRDFNGTEVGERPLIVGIGGTTRPGSTSEQAMHAALQFAEELGARTIAYTATDLDFPMYDPKNEPSARARAFLEDISNSDGIIVSSPGYHGSYSGLLKNAVDYMEELRSAPRPYWEQRSVGLIVCAYGWQATTSAVFSLRQVVHAMRGWPTPIGVGINSAESPLAATGRFADSELRWLKALAVDVVEFANARIALRAS